MLADDLVQARDAAIFELALCRCSAHLTATLVPLFQGQVSFLPHLENSLISCLKSLTVLLLQFCCLLLKVSLLGSQLAHQGLLIAIADLLELLHLHDLLGNVSLVIRDLLLRSLQ